MYKLLCLAVLTLSLAMASCTKPDMGTDEMPSAAPAESAPIEPEGAEQPAGGAEGEAADEAVE